MAFARKRFTELFFRGDSYDYRLNMERHIPAVRYVTQASGNKDKDGFITSDRLKSEDSLLQGTKQSSMRVCINSGKIASLCRKQRLAKMNSLPLASVGLWLVR